MIVFLSKLSGVKTFMKKISWAGNKNPFDIPKLSQRVTIAGQYKKNYFNHMV